MWLYKNAFLELKPPARFSSPKAHYLTYFSKHLLKLETSEVLSVPEQFWRRKTEITMSDVQQGPDWWLASDGKWYPQTSKADYRPPSPPQPPAPPSPPAPPPVGWQAQQPQVWPGYPAVYVKPPGVSTTFSGWLQAVFWLSAAFYVALALTSLAAMSGIGSVTESASQYKTWADAHNTLNGFRVAGIYLSISVLVLLVIWCFQTHKAASSLEPGERRWSRGWAIGGWFIPVAGYVIPLLVFLETERIATAQRWNGRVNANWRRTGTVERSGWGWWCLYFLSVALILSVDHFPTW